MASSLGCLPLVEFSQRGEWELKGSVSTASSLSSKSFDIQLQLLGLYALFPTLAFRLYCANSSPPFKPHTLEPLYCEFF